MEIFLVLEDQPSADRMSQARGFTFKELGASGLQQSKHIEHSTNLAVM